jgi:hypothetical protein
VSADLGHPELREIRKPTMKPTHAGDAIHSGWRPPPIRVGRPRVHAPRSGGLGVRARLALVAVVVLAISLGAVAVLEDLTPAEAPPAAATPGTAFLGKTTCADWRDASVAKRMTIVQTLAVAATHPDPESPGATLGDGAAYGLFQRVCSGSAPGSTLLYESYNRAASFDSVRAGAPAVSGTFGSR